MKSNLPTITGKLNKGKVSDIAENMAKSRLLDEEEETRAVKRKRFQYWFGLCLGSKLIVQEE